MPATEDRRVWRACLVRRAISVLLVLLDLVDHLVLAVKRAISVQWVSLVTKVNPVFLATLECPVSKVAKVNLVFLVSVVLDSPVSPARGVRRVFPDFRANPVLKDLPDPLDIPETKVIEVYPDWTVCPDPEVTRVTLVHPDLLVLQV